MEFKIEDLDIYSDRYVIIMRGQPGSGKSTLAKEICKYINKQMPDQEKDGMAIKPTTSYMDDAECNDGVKICSADHFFLDDDGKYVFESSLLGEAHKFCFHDFYDYVSNGYLQYVIIVDNTNIDPIDISPYVVLGELFNYKVIVVQIEHDPNHSAKRNIHGVPDKKVVSMYERMNKIKLPSRWDVRKYESK